jgi:hypothetical protein
MLLPVEQEAPLGVHSFINMRTDVPLANGTAAQEERTTMSLGTILIIILILALLGGFSGLGGGPFYGTGYYGGGGLGLVLLIVIILVLLGRI